MDYSNLESLQKIAPASELGKIRLFLDLVPHLKKQDVPDPYYGPLNEFEKVLDLIEEAAKGLLKEICQQHLTHIALANC
jgi:protein-tyrosine phosphatase